MDLLSTSTEWFLCINNTLLNIKFTLIEPNKLKITTTDNIIFTYTEKNNVLLLYMDNILIATISKYNQKTLKYTEYKSGKILFTALLF